MAGQEKDKNYSRNNIDKIPRCNSTMRHNFAMDWMSKKSTILLALY